jgi:hypothetical protein
VRVRAVAAVIAAAAALAYAAASASAGTYTVVQCHAPAPQNYAHEGEASTLPPVGVYEIRTDCTAAAGNNSIRIDVEAKAVQGHRGRVTWTAPPGTTITGVQLSARLRRDGGQRSRIYMANAAGAIAAQFATGGTEPAAFGPHSWSTPAGHPGYPKLVAELACVNDNCAYANTSDALTHVRYVRLTLEDRSAPSVSLGGDLLTPGWKRGSGRLSLASVDEGAGLDAMSVIVNGATVSGGGLAPCALIAGTMLAKVVRPCPPGHHLERSISTAEQPFVDGENSVWGCARDFGSSGFGTCTSRTVRVDNTQPEVVFLHLPNPADPELIRARVDDATSGVDFDPLRDLVRYRQVGDAQWRPLVTEYHSGELRTYVDSTAVPPGEYEFRAEIRDRAGNEAVTTQREDGRPMRLRFPLKAPARLDATLTGGQQRLTVPYRKPSVVRGVLRGGTGAPLDGEQVKVVERFDEGALIDRRVRWVETDEEGRFRSGIPGGPSREIEAIFEGSRSHVAATSDELDLNVKSKVELKLRRSRIRAGSRAVFTGRVGRYFARLPEGGKLVELQVKEGRGRWNTLKEAQGTTAKGRIRLSHRFRAYYTRPVTFVFRLKATKEGRWPYRAPVASKIRRLKVVPKR